MIRQENEKDFWSAAVPVSFMWARVASIDFSSASELQQSSHHGRPHHERTGGSHIVVMDAPPPPLGDTSPPCFPHATIPLYGSFDVDSGTGAAMLNSRSRHHLAPAWDCSGALRRRPMCPSESLKGAAMRLHRQVRANCAALPPYSGMCACMGATRRLQTSSSVSMSHRSRLCLAGPDGFESYRSDHRIKAAEAGGSRHACCGDVLVQPLEPVPHTTPAMILGCSDSGCPLQRPALTERQYWGKATSHGESP